MKKLVLFLMFCLSLVLFLPRDSEAKWTYCNSDSSFYETIDDERVDFNNDILSFWVKSHFYKTGNTYVCRKQCNVGNRTHRTIYVVIYRPDGTNPSYSTPSADWEPIVPGTNLEYTANKAADIFLKNNKIES